AEDGIRDFHVTGVQTCALPISHTSVVISAHGTLQGLIENKQTTEIKNNRMHQANNTDEPSQAEPGNNNSIVITHILCSMCTNVFISCPEFCPSPNWFALHSHPGRDELSRRVDGESYFGYERIVCFPDF